MTRVDTKLASRSRASFALYRVGRTLCVAFCRLWMRMTVEGLEHVPTTGAFILAPIHRSNIDTPIVAVCSRRRLRYMGKDSLWNHRKLGWLLSALGGFPVSRDMADREALERCIQVLGGGEPLVLFPEGERKTGPLVQPLKDGAAYIAMRAGVPIVPVGIGGSERAMPKGAKMVYPRRVHIIIGPPIPTSVGDKGRITRSARAAVSAQLSSELQRLFDAAQIRVGA